MSKKIIEIQVGGKSLEADLTSLATAVGISRSELDNLCKTQPPAKPEGERVPILTSSLKWFASSACNARTADSRLIQKMAKEIISLRSSHAALVGFAHKVATALIIADDDHAQIRIDLQNEAREILAKHKEESP